MDDLISRQAAVKAIDRHTFDTDEGLCLDEDITIILEEVPTAKPKKGHWIRHPEVKNIYGGTYIECSECGEKYVVQHMEDEKFCRNCGADMREVTA